MTSTNRTYNLSNIIDTAIGFTDRDEVLVSLHDICKYHLVLEPTQDMVIFNDNCYDRKRFDNLNNFYLQKYNDAMIRGYYRYRKVIRDSRTNQDMDYDDAMTHYYYDSIPVPELQSVLTGVSPIFR